MAIPIIGQGSIITGRATQEKQLPRAEVDLPPPASAPANQPVRDREGWAHLADHPVAMMKGVLLEHIARSAEPKAWIDVLMKMAADSGGPVAERAIAVLGELGHAPAADLAEKRFRESDGELAAAAATALGRMSAPRLLEAVKARSRLDDIAYVQTVSALARSENAEALDWLGKSLNRAGALTPERRSALYSAVLLSGRADLCSRVVGMAISDSRDPGTAKEASAARIAMASIAGLPPVMAPVEAGEGVCAGLKDAIKEARDIDASALAASLDKGETAAGLESLAPMVERSLPADASNEQASVLRRRQGLLRALVEQKDAIARLDSSGAAIFVGAAFAAAELIAMSSRKPEDSLAMATLTKVMGLEPAAIVAMDDAALEARFTADGERKMRQVAGVLANEPVGSAKILERMLGAMVRAGAGGVVFDAASTTKLEMFAGVALKTLVTTPIAAEEAALEALERRPLDDRATRLALAIAGRTGTERLARAIGRRYYDVRDIARAALADACIHVGDVRLVPLVESRAFADEPEELAWAMLKMLGGAKPDEDPKIAALVARVEAHGNPTTLGEVEGGIRLPLTCSTCKETLSYTMVRVYLDPKSKSKDGDPAFAGDVTCKACGAENTLSATPSAVGLMSESMMRLLTEQQQGIRPTEPPRVIPRGTRYMGREVGLAEALRLATTDAETSPTSIRAQLRRGQLRLALWRKGARQDAEAALKIDPKSPEALLLIGGTYAQAGDFPGALVHLSAALARMRSADEPRLYESDNDALLEEIEDAILELEDLGVDLPDSLDLEVARERRQAMINAEIDRQEAQQS